MKKLTVFVMIPVVALTLAVYAASCHCGNPNPSPPPLASRGGESPPLLKQEGAGGVATHRSAILRDFSSESEMNRWNRGYGVTEDTSISAGATRRTLGLMNYGLTNARSGVDGWQLAHGTPLPFERFSHASVVVNGRLYVIGGCSASSCDPAEKDVRFATLMADGTIGGWSSANDLPANRRGHAAVAHHGRIYVTGGTIGPDGEFNTADTVFVATVNPDGTLGVWSETTKMLDKRYDHASVVYNDYLYVLGGFNYGGKLRAVDFAKIKPDGTLGAWTSTVILPTATRGHSAAAYEGFVYVVGGAGTEGVVLYAKINGDGTIGNWTSEAAVPGAGRVYHAGVAYNGHLYVTGGTNENYVTYIPINADGSLGTAWTQGTSIPNGRWQHSSVVHNGFLYVIGGTDATGIKSYIHFAPIRPDGSVGTTWVNASTLADDRYGHTVAIHNGFYYLVGGVVRGSYSNDVSFAPIKADGTLGAFTPTAQFATGRAFHSGAILNGYLYVFSGSGQSGTLDDVQFAQIKADGSLDPWVTTTSVPVGRAYSAAATHAGRLYVTGGLGAMSSTIYTQPNPDGTISAGGWQNGDALAVGRQDHSSVVYNGYLYVLGGFTASNYTNTVWKALIDAGGNPTGWATTTAMPEISGNHASAVFNGDLYVIGGRNDSATINFVQRAHFNPDGTIPAGGWSYTTSLPGTRKFLAGGIHNGYAIVSGGCADVACGTKLADALSAPVNANGEFSEMQALPDLPVGRFWHAMAAWKGCVYVTGGYDGNATSATYFAKALPEGAISGWTPGPSFQNARFGHKSIALNGYLYVIGGFNNVSYLRDVQYAPIYEADCSIGGWSPAQQLPVPLAYHAAAAYNGRIYALGGFGGGFSAKVYYSTANVDGSLSAWNEATDLPTSVSDLEAAAHGGFLYAIGGENGSNPRDDVLYARLNADGSIGAWTQTTKLDKPKYAMASVLYNGFVYLFGGTGSSGPLADVVSAPLNTDGSVGEWNPVGSLASAEQRLAGAAHNGSVYLTGGLANPAKAISARLTTQQASLKSHGSALFDMGVGTDFNTLYVNGRLAGPGSKITVKYRIAPQGGVFGNWGTPTDLTSLQGTVSLGANFGRYIEVAYTIDDNGKDSMSEGKGTSEIFGFLLDFTSLSNGGFCGTDPNVCQSFYCVQGVCCNTGCTTQQQCMEASCATGTCAITDKTPATQCDDSNPCTKSDTCSAKACENNLVPCTQDAECTSSYRCIAVCAGTAYTCMPTECQTDSQCDGAGGCTVANRNAGEPCTDTNVNDCFVSQCDGNGSCDQQRGLQDPTYRCGTSSGELCDLHDFCSGTSGTCVDAVEPGGTKACRTPVNECENDVYCDGTNKFCPVLPSFKPDTERCSDTDNKWCTDDYCDGNGGCSKHVAGNDGCFIGGDCLGEGSRNPANECQVCDSTRNKTSWSNVNQGTPCAVDAFDCTKDVCDGNGACAHPIDQNWCLIDAKCYQGNAENPDNSCQLCDTWKGQDKWTNRTAGSSCDDKDPCTSETKCDATGQCAGGTYDPTLPGCKCDSDADCTIPGATHCDVAGGGQCVECTADGHCGAGDKCNPATHRCETAKCQGDPDCGDAGKPHCRVVTGACVQCYLESHCKPDENCNLSTFTCERAVECSTDAECRLRDPGRPICGPENTCVECIENDHCGADGSGRTICNPETWVCVECMVNPDCEEFHPETPFCRKSDFLCVECIEDRDCGAGKSCDEPAGKCNPDLPDAGTDAGKDAGTKCTSNAQCGGATPVCNVADGKCVECLENSTCVLGHPGQIYCHSTLHKCVECVTSYTCTGGKTCDASTGTCVGKTTDGGTPQTDGGTPNGDGGTPPEDTGGGQPPGGEDAGEPAAEGMKNPYGCMCATLSL